MATYCLTSFELDFSQETLCLDRTLTIIILAGLVVTYKYILSCSCNICMSLFALLAAFRETLGLQYCGAEQTSQFFLKGQA